MRIYRLVFLEWFELSKCKIRLQSIWTCRMWVWNKYACIFDWKKKHNIFRTKVETIDLKFVSEFQYGTRYNWSNSQQSLLLSAYYYGFMPTLLLGGLLNQLFGPRVVVGTCIGLSAIATGFIPLAAGISYWAVFFVRVFIGAMTVSRFGLIYFFSHFYGSLLCDNMSNFILSIFSFENK